MANQKENQNPECEKLPKIQTYNRDFLEALVENQKDLRVESGKSCTEEPQIEWQTLQCPICTAPQENTHGLVDHLVKIHGSDEDHLSFRKFETVSNPMNLIYQEVIQWQNDQSWVKRKFLNSEDVICCPISSPLAPFLFMRHLQVYSARTSVDGVELKVKKSIHDYRNESKTTVIFCWGKIEKVRQKIKEKREERRIQKRIQFLQRECGQWILQNDLVTKPTRRSAEEKTMLAKALNLKAKFTQEELMGKMDEIRAESEKEEERKREAENCNTKPTGIKADGTRMTVEEKNLHSALVNVTVSGKRRRPLVLKQVEPMVKIQKN